MGKNILIFSDGTGQAGGYMPDEARSNIYKLFRATRVSPDTSIDPKEQIAFYDGGIGSRAHGEGIRLRLWRRIYNLLGRATGLGITQNIIDCYAAIIRVWQPGDRIYLFGFSRGAYTVRCVGGVLKYCGVPTAVAHGPGRVRPLKRDPKSARRIAAEAVKHVYQYGSSIRGDPYRAERERRAARFRAKYVCGDEQVSNTAPYFIGVWDTVGSLGMGGSGIVLVAGLHMLAAAILALPLAMPTAMLLELPYWPSYLTAFAALFVGVPTAGYAAACARHRGLASLARYRMGFYDTKLGYAVRYARQALAIDENRKKFDCVPWDEDPASRAPPDEPSASARFKQLWFAGSHSDIGGSYPETESRLSDITLAWMVEEAIALPHPIRVDRSVLKLYPDHAALQHDERKASLAAFPGWVARCALLVLGRKTFPWREGYRRIPADAHLHPTVLERFQLAGVLMHDHIGPYRPPALRRHWAVKGFWPRATRTTTAAASARRPTRRLEARHPAPAGRRRRWWQARYR